MRKTEYIVYLLRRHIEGELTKEEQQELETWSAMHPSNRQLLEEMSDPDTLFRELASMDNAYGDDREASIKRMYARIDPKVSVSRPIKRNLIVRLRKWLPYAVAILLFAIVGVTLWKTTPVEEKPQTIVADIEPGGPKAVLTLADGRQVSLREDQGYIVLQDGDMRYSDGSRVLIDGAGSPVGDEPRYLSISVPKGGTYQVILSDGTKVWLNSSSTLRYPERFAGLQRLVELEGEAYFEVSSLQEEGKKSRFVVKSRHQQIEVLGTQFNVSAYSDQKEIVTTLVEGSVSVVPNANPSDRFLLRPGYQSAVLGNDRSIKEVDVAQYIAWKEGLFYFKNTSFEEMMDQITNWYDIEIVYKSKVPNETFTGKISRNLSLMTFLELLNVSNVSVSLEGKKLMVD